MNVLNLQKKKSLFNLISYRPDIDKLYLYDNDPYEAKYQFLINKRDTTAAKNLNDFKVFIEYSNDIDYIHKNIEKYNPNRKLKMLIFFKDIIADMFSNKKYNPIATELFIRGRKLNFFCFYDTILFCCSKKY